MKKNLFSPLALLLLALALLAPASVFAASNDNFDSATVISALPFSTTADVSTATNEYLEPQSYCGWSSNTVWYAYTATSSTWLQVPSNMMFGGHVVAVYTGSALNSLSLLNCNTYYSTPFYVDAGTTYYFQAGGLYGQTSPFTFQLDIARPSVSFYPNPPEPSVFDNVQFCAQANDPAPVGIQTRLWDFGDGGTAADYCVTHRFASNGDYNVKLTVTTFDGRSASYTQVVHVRTQDVAIARFSAPNTGSAGQTRQLSVDVLGDRYGADLTVQVQLLKSDPNQTNPYPWPGIYPGYQVVGTLTNLVPVRSGNHTTPFSFNYTFTSNDATIGKVTFKAVATIVGGRDALPADNEAIAPSTKVTR